MQLRRTMIGLGSVIVLTLAGVVACTQQESGTAVPSADGESSQPTVPTEDTLPTDDPFPTDEPLPTDETLPSDDTFPTDQTLPSDDTFPTDEPFPTDETLPTDGGPTGTADPTNPDDTGDLTAPDTATAPTSGTTSTTKSTSAWSAGPNKASGTPVPVFPDSLPDWRLNNSWDATSRAVVGDWTPAKGPDNGNFPSTVSGCDLQRFLVRWRANDDQARIEARWINAAGIAGQPVAGHAGWFDLDGCTTPQFRFVNSDGVATRSSISVSVQQYFPAQ